MSNHCRVLSTLLLAASCANPLIAFADTEQPAFNPTGLSLRTGVYRCELNRTVNVRQVGEDLRSAVVHWNRKDYPMTAVHTASGALRYEHQPSGLVWLVIATKSMLLDTRVGRQLANECKV